MISCNSYQDILSPEEEQELENQKKLKKIYETERAEYLAEMREDQEE